MKSPAAPTERTQRLFFALWVPEAARAVLQRVAAPLLAQVRGRALSSADWHLTLCFLGAVSPGLVPALQAVAAQLPAEAFELPLTRLGYWRAARVIAVSAEQAPEPARQLSAGLRAAARTLGLAPDDKPLRPHVTLMRGVSPALWQRALAGGLADTPPLTLTIAAQEFCLAESCGDGRDGTARYALLARWPLGR